MRITLVSPSLDASTGNARTAQRWAQLLGELGHAVHTELSRPLITPNDPPRDGDLLVAIHARKSAAEIEAWHIHRPDAPIVLLLAGTDLYDDLPGDPDARRSLSRASRLIVLHPHAVEDLPNEYRDRTVYLPQSITPPSQLPPRPSDRFLVLVASNLREVKDPLRTREALDRLPAESQIEVDHIGVALDEAYRTELERRPHPKYHYLGPVDPEEALLRIAGAHVLSITSRLEGGANVVSESIVLGTPVIASRIAGSVGLLGDHYPGFFDVGDTVGLAHLLTRVESEPTFYRSLQKHLESRAPEFHPDIERERWRALLAAWEE
ncbi:MAG: selenoneine biosynthesis selenosugar synthase SenB [Planctomycetota bacterium]